MTVERVSQDFADAYVRACASLGIRPGAKPHRSIGVTGPGNASLSGASVTLVILDDVGDSEADEQARIAVEGEDVAA